MKILSINAGSATLKYTLFEMPEEKRLASGVFEKIGMPDSFYSIKINGEKIEKKAILESHKNSFEILVSELLKYNIVKDLSEIEGVGHRIVQGGSYFDKSELINEDVISKIDELSILGPLHNPPAITGIRAAQSVIPNATQTAIFDTAFHQTMKEENYLYALPYEWYEKYKIRRYGAHGTSHKYVMLRANEILGRSDTKLITCHIGNGASISAVKNGKCVNTSMGLTPNAGLIMGTRCGDIDATIVTYMMDKFKCTPKEMDNILNKKSGILGISELSNDLRDIENEVFKGNERCILAGKMYAKRIIDYIAKYYVELEGCDAIIFTAGVGEKSIVIRKEVIRGLKVLGIKLDEEANNSISKEVKISLEDSSVPVYVIPTDEELMIAKDTFNIIEMSKKNG